MQKYAFERSLRRLVSPDSSPSDRIVICCGDYISREAGLPPLKGWKIGEGSYTAELMQTRVSFKRMWWEVWAWYAYRISLALETDEHEIHKSIVDLLSLLQNKSCAISLTSDGLLRRAATSAVDEGNHLSNQQLIELQGNLTTLKCDFKGHPHPHPHEEFPLTEFPGVDSWSDFTSRKISLREVEQIKCPLCMSPARPSEPFHDDAETGFAGSEFLQRIEKQCKILLLVGIPSAHCSSSSFISSLTKATEDNGGSVIRMCSPERHGRPEDPLNAFGQTGIRASDPPVVFNKTKQLPTEDSSTAMILPSLSSFVDSAEEILSEFNIKPNSYRRMSTRVTSV